MKKRQFKQRLFFMFVIAILAISLSSTFATAQNNVLTVESSYLNVRQGPGLSYELMDELQQGDRLNVLEEEHGWYKIRLADDRIGWVASWLVTENSPEYYQNTFARVTHDYANVRQYASSDSGLLGTVYQGTELKVKYKEKDWVQVDYQGQLAWIQVDLLELYEGSQVPDIQEGQAEDIQEDLTLAPAQYDIPINQATIVLDAGHGGSDPGAIADDLYEKEITFKTTTRLAQRLRDTGANVVLTRVDDSDVSLSQRAQMANDHQAHAFISIHYDASPEDNMRSGTSLYYYDDNDIVLAETMSSYLTSYGLLQHHGMSFGDFEVLRENTQPAILVELGYMNHDTDRSIIYTDYYQDIIVEALYHGILDFFS